MNSIDDMIGNMNIAIKSIEELKDYLNKLLNIYDSDKLYYDNSSIDRNYIQKFLNSLDNVKSSINEKHTNLKYFKENWLPKILSLKGSNLSKSQSYTVSSNTKYSYHRDSFGNNVHDNDKDLTTITVEKNHVNITFSSVDSTTDNLQVHFCVTEDLYEEITIKTSSSCKIESKKKLSNSYDVVFSFPNNESGYNDFKQCYNAKFAMGKSADKLIWGTKNFEFKNKAMSVGAAFKPA